MPLYYQPNLTWSDSISSNQGLLSGLKKTIIRSLIPFMPKALSLVNTYQFKSPNRIEGKIGNGFFKKIHYTSVELDAHNQLLNLQVDDYSLKKVGK